MTQNDYRRTIYTCYLSYITQAIIVNLAPVMFIVFRNEFGLSLEMLGRLVLINFGTQLVTDILSIRFIDRFGQRVAGILAHALALLGLFALGILPRLLPSPYVGLVIATMLYAVGGGLIEVIVSPIIDAIPSDAKASAMSLLHSFYSWGQVVVVLLTTLLIKLMGDHLWYLLPLLWSLVPLVCLVQFTSIPLADAVGAHQRTSLKKLFSSHVFVVAMILMFAGGAAEQSMAQWSSYFAEKGIGVSKLMGDLFGPCLFAVFMGVGRALYGVYGMRIPLKKVLFFSSVLCVLCYLLAALSKNPFLSLLGCALTGLSVSLMWPGMLSLTSENYPKGGTALFAVLALLGDAGCSFGPYLTGLVSDLTAHSQKLIDYAAINGLSIEQIGLKLGLLAAIVFPVMMIIGIGFIQKKKTK